MLICGGSLEALREKIFEVGPDGRTVAQLIAEMLIDETLHGRNRIAAAASILDRLVGRPPQQLDLNNITPDFADRTDQELHFYLENSRWPETKKLTAAPSEKVEDSKPQ
jgi:hypothetical protein